MALRITELSGSRLELAIDLFADGRQFIFNDVYLGHTAEGHVWCCAISQWQTANLDDATALAELQRAKAAFAEVVAASPRFGQLTAGLPVRYSVTDVSDSVELCYEKDGQVVWPHGSP